MIIDKNGFTREKNGYKRLNKPDRKLPQSELPWVTFYVQVRINAMVVYHMSFIQLIFRLFSSFQQIFLIGSLKTKDQVQIKQMGFGEIIENHILRYFLSFYKKVFMSTSNTINKLSIFSSLFFGQIFYLHLSIHHPHHLKS